MTYQTPYRAPVQQPAVADAHVVVAWVAAVLTLGYMLPWAIAASRRKSNTTLIAVINFLLGLSVIGWIVALVMACSTDPVTVAAVHVNVYQPMQAPPGWYPDANGVRHYWNGTAWTS